MTRGLLAVCAGAVTTVLGVVAVSSQVPPAISSATLVGAKTCAECHDTKHETWTQGRHSKMLQPAGPAAVKGDFSRGALTLRGSQYTLETVDGRYFVTESTLTGKPRSHRVEYTLGSRRIQHYLTTLENGWVVILPPTWDVERQEWFHNMDIVRPDEDPSTLVQQWNKNCVGCHVSEQDNHYDPATGAYATTWRDYGTTCERCHGPGTAHVNKYRLATSRGSSADTLIVRPTRLGAAGSMICAQCHSLRNVIAPGYQAGRSYYDYFLPQLEYGPKHPQDPSYWADGRPRRFSNDAIGLWQSQCFLQGGVACTNCHLDPHLPDVDRSPQLAPTNNALCTGCHQQIGQALATHTRHRPESAGSSCVECHMPKTVTGIKTTMRDHTIGLPAPENSVRFGIPNACTACHRDRSDAWAVTWTTEWWPENRRSAFVARAETFTAARSGRPDAIDGLLTLLGDARGGPVVQANAAGYLRLSSDPRGRAALLTAAASPWPLVRAVAVSSLGQMTGAQDVQARRTAIVKALGDSQRSVRVSAVASLVGMTPERLGPDDEARFAVAREEFIALVRQHPDDASSQRDLGLLYLQSGDFDSAAAALERCLALEPERPSATFLLGLARLGQKRSADAYTLLGTVAPGDPFYADAQRVMKDLAPK